ncbi:uncharacterized protein LOC130809931 [Amaranthus tricolor]|uniref:uncharacterized protein LOC130809931 n=1 Tax=Amaranthus tricolor TaxID=29722 RepID=UPI002584E002|nr:uncharacterized protein LOC130809931 [Amaranthus tricolor]
MVKSSLLLFLHLLWLELSLLAVASISGSKCTNSCPCHLAIKALNFDLHPWGENRMLQLVELDELCLDAYKISKLYKERTKRWHDKHIQRREFKEGELVLLFNSRLKLFPGKLKSRWSGPFHVTKVFPYGSVEVWSEGSGTFKVNRQRLKHYRTGITVQGNQVYNISLPSSY